MGVWPGTPIDAPPVAYGVVLAAGLVVALILWALDR